MRNIEDRLIENHLAFLASHRGPVRQSGEIKYIDSDRPEFAYALLRNSSSLDELPANLQTVQHFPWCPLSVSDLTGAGFTLTYGVSYMIFGKGLLDVNAQSDFVVTQVPDESEMDVFSEIQARGFNETPESYNYWQAWLKAANHRNLKNPHQIFYVGHIKGEPAGTALTVFENGSAGIYAVATLPQHRKKGVSTQILGEAIEDASSRGADLITLQVLQDSYAEKFYQRLGFERVFTTGMYRRNL